MWSSARRTSSLWRAIGSRRRAQASRLRLGALGVRVHARGHVKYQQGREWALDAKEPEPRSGVVSEIGTRSTFSDGWLAAAGISWRLWLSFLSSSSILSSSILANENVNKKLF